MIWSDTCRDLEEWTEYFAAITKNDYRNNLFCHRPFSTDFGKIQLFLQLGIFLQIILSCESYWVKNYYRKTVMLSFLTVIDTTFHLIINISFLGAVISALQLYDWENPFELGKKTFNLALGMGPYFGPVRALKKACVITYPLCAKMAKTSLGRFLSCVFHTFWLRHLVDTLISFA